ncbi:MAG: hypothetical protein GXY76_21540 [Chloroflexi bacterium]|nr:hypothetical protein [Chloroflexota bacterium]
MSENVRRPALFEGLVYDEGGRLLEVAYVGNSPCYVLLDGDFRRHIDSAGIDQPVLAMFRDQALANEDLVTTKMMEMLGKDDIFTKAMILDSFKNIDRIMEIGLPEDARNMLGMIGFRIVIDSHGEIVEVKLPQESGGWEE